MKLIAEYSVVMKTTFPHVPKTTTLNGSKEMNNIRVSLILRTRLGVGVLGGFPLTHSSGHLEPGIFAADIATILQFKFGGKIVHQDLRRLLLSKRQISEPPLPPSRGINFSERKPLRKTKLGRICKKFFLLTVTWNGTYLHRWVLLFGTPDRRGILHILEMIC